MHTRATALIASLGLTPHPEGGHYREVYRSLSRVHTVGGRPERAALTTIYFLLEGDDVSRWHQVDSDEVWHHYEGDALELLTADAGFERVSRDLLGRVGDNARPVHVVPAGHWQAARSAGAYTLVGCTVAPGFEFADFRMLRDQNAQAESVLRRHPNLASFL